MRPSALPCALLLLLCARPADPVDGINLPGSDYDNFSADSAFVCRQTCAADSRCQSYTWVKPGIQGPRGRCWLKHRVPALVRDSCCDSGSAANILGSQLRAENHTNRPGSDYRSFSSGDHRVCQLACSEESQCSAWTWVRPGVQGPRGNCWLKTGAPHPVTDTNCISGVRLRPRTVRFD
jgi:hypothetical protein